MSNADDYPPCSNVFNGSTPVVHCLSRTESLWLLVAGGAGIASGIAVLGVFLYILRNAYRHRLRNRRWPDFTTRPMDVYLLSLFAADLFHALAELVNLKWVNDGNVHSGSACSFQAVFISLGSNSIALSTAAITLHTFFILFKKGTTSGPLAITVTAISWIYIVLFNIVLMGTHKNLAAVYAPTPSWCGIANNFIAYKILSEYFFLWGSLGLSFLVYIPLSLIAVGYIDTVQDKWWKFKRSREVARPGQRRLFYAMILYPIAYTVTFLPACIARWRWLLVGDVSPIVQIGTKALWNLAGVADVALFVMTRRDVLLFQDGANSDGQAPALNGEGEQVPMEDVGMLPDRAEGG